MPGLRIWIMSSEARWQRPSDHNPNGSRPAASGQAGLGRAANVGRAIGATPASRRGTAQRSDELGNVTSLKHSGNIMLMPRLS